MAGFEEKKKLLIKSSSLAQAHHTQTLPVAEIKVASVMTKGIGNDWIDVDVRMY